MSNNLLPSFIPPLLTHSFSPLRRAASLLVFVAFLRVGALAGVARAGTPDGARSLAPYFAVSGGPGSLPLERTSADVRIAGTIAEVTVKQVYRNDGTTPLHATYVFPASTRAAVHALRMRIGERIVDATIKERAQARAEYEAAKANGQTASLLEEERPNVFTMKVANVLPGERILVELRYTEHLVTDAGEVEFVYPQTVGPRYVGKGAGAGSAGGASSDSGNGGDSASRGRATMSSDAGVAYQRAGAPQSFATDISVVLAAGVPIAALSSPSHAISTNYSPARDVATIRQAASETSPDDRDFILRYRLGDAAITSGLLLYKGETENFFLMTMQPPARATTTDVLPRETIFVVDVSGSMHGFPLETATALLEKLTAQMRPVDTFNVLLFAGDSTVLFDKSMPATAANITLATELLRGEAGGGGTELPAALRRALELPRAPETSPVRDTSFVVITDGFIGMEAESFELVRKLRGTANVFAFGIGSSVNRYFVEGLARAGAGEAFIVETPAAAAATANRFLQYISAPLLSNIKISFNGFDAYDVENEAPPTLFAERPIIVFGKWRGAATGTISVTGQLAQGRFDQTISVASVKPEPGNGALVRLWARSQIARLADATGTDVHRDEVLALGLKYSLLTPYTSFVAVDKVVRTNVLGQEVVQPAPMPKGVSDLAVGEPTTDDGYGEGTEPELLLLLPAGVLMALRARRRAERARRERLAQLALQAVESSRLASSNDDVRAA